MFRLVFVAAAVFSCGAVFANDYMIIHARNQKLGSDVAAYWRTISGADQPRDFAKIHENNQKVGSEVAALWTLLRAHSDADCE